MNDEQVPAAESGASDDTPQTEGGAAPAGMIGDMMSSGVGMVTLGCLVIIGIYLITGLMLNEYWIPWIILVPAIAVVVLSRMGSKSAEKVAPIPTIIKILGLLIALFGVLDLIEDIRFASSSFDEAVDVIGSLLFWGAAALCFVGARRIET